MADHCHMAVANYHSQALSNNRGTIYWLSSNILIQKALGRAH